MVDERHRNCWTCGWDLGPGLDCLAPTYQDGGDNSLIDVWVDLHCEDRKDGTNMPPRETPPCPGWKAKGTPDAP